MDAERWRGEQPGQGELAWVTRFAGVTRLVCVIGLVSCSGGAGGDEAASSGGNTGSSSGGAAASDSGGGAPPGEPAKASGGMAAGGETSGGAPSLGGETASGGREPSSGGSSGASTGGASAGGASTGGASTGGASTGGASTGGASTGGGSSGGAPGSGAASGGAGECELVPRPATPIGYGAQTTGGGETPPLRVSSFEQAELALAAYREAFESGSEAALVLEYDGVFDFSSISDVCQQHTLASKILQIKEMENVTLRGAPGSSANFGVKINRARNVIIQNMTFGLLPGGGDADAISIEGNGTNGDVEHVWIDHNELFSSLKDDCDGAGDTEFDGLIDVKKGARYITISYNYLHDHQKTGLLGHSDTDDVDRYVTFHHNWYHNVGSRTPLHRFGYVHLFNNYYSGILSSGINVRMGGVALIESNYFENSVNPVTSRYSTVQGYWELRSNFVGEGISWTLTSDTLKNADDWQSTAEFPEAELGYSYHPDEASCVKTIVMATAGARL